MRTIHLKTNQNRLIANLRHAFNQSSMLSELLQNARRAQASTIHVTVDGDTLTVSDDGAGIDDLQTLIFIAESGWDETLKARENAFGLGVLSTLYFSHHLSVHSRDQTFSAATASIIGGESIEVHSASPRAGTAIRLDGVHSPQAGQSLGEWTERQLARLCEAFPVTVFFNGSEISRPLADPALHWRQTSMGRVLVDLSAPRSRWRCFLQGLPIGQDSRSFRNQVIMLPDDTLAKLPDRQHLLNEKEDHGRIQSAVDQAYREALTETKARLAASEFVEHYGQCCLDSANADLLNDIPFIPCAWTRDWGSDPAGFPQHWSRHHSDGVISRQEMEELGVWKIETDEDDEPTAEVYLEAANAFLLEVHGLDAGHWLNNLVKVITPDQIRIRYGKAMHYEQHPGLADYEVELQLFDTLHVSVEGEPEYAVHAVRKDFTLYLTASAVNPARLVCDYIFDDRFEEDRLDEDARIIDTFIAVGCSSSPDRVVEALLPHALRYGAHIKLANATVHLSFDETGKLRAVTT